jgi:2-methylcitrate dehydratase PrpD
MILDELARFAVSLRPPPAIVDQAKACILYGLAVGAAGIRAPQAAQAARAAGDAPGRSTRFLDGAQHDAQAAAFANGTLLHARVQDDAHPAGHVGVVVLPATLAMAEATHASGSDAIAALVAGYEVALRIGRDHAADLSARGFRTTPTYGAFGAATAAGRLSKLSPEAMSHALALAANMAGGLREYSEAGSEDYAFQAGMAARNGITAARLAAAGATSGPSALDGKAGFFRAFGEAGRDYASRVTQGLGETFEMLGVTYKPYPICQFHRGIVRGAAALRERAGSTPVAALTIRMHPFEADFFGVRYAGPFTTFPQTLMSAPFCAALAWARGDATLGGLTDFGAQDVLALVPRVAVESDASRERYSPRLDARLADGTVLDWEEREGAGAYVLTLASARMMVERLAREAGFDAGGLAASVDTLPGAKDVMAVVSAMRAACRAAKIGA